MRFILFIILKHSFLVLLIVEEDLTLDSMPPFTNQNHEITMYVLKSNLLDFSLDPRPNLYSSDPNATIKLRKKGIRMNEQMKWQMLTIASDFGASFMNKQQRDTLFVAIIKTQSYLCGFKRPAMGLKYFTEHWFKYKTISRTDPSNLEHVFSSKVTRERVTYIDAIDTLFPRFLHLLYRYGINVLGSFAKTTSLVEVMNKKSAALHPECPIRRNLNLTKHHFWKFFNSYNGRVVRYCTKPRLTDEKKMLRVGFAIKWKDMIRQISELFICFLDEKIFYTTTRRKKMKILPRASWESIEDAKVVLPKERTQRFPVKLMAMGVVSKPYPEHNFDGKIYIKRIATEKITPKNSYNQNLSNLYEINHQLKQGDWKFMFGDVPQDTSQYNITVGEALELIVDLYDIQKGDELCFSYKSHTNTGKSVKWVRLTSGFMLKDREIVTSNGVRRSLKLEDLILHSNIKPGSTIVRDVTCDSKYMLENIDDIGQSIRTSFHWVENTKVIYLFIHNAGGHGTTENKRLYEQTLKEKYNVQIVWQIPNSPELNMLDLGAWMAIQSEVEEVHKTRVMRNDVLEESVIQAFNNIPAQTLQNIYDRWVKVLDIIIVSRGGNDDIDRYRGNTPVLDHLSHEMSTSQLQSLIENSDSTDDEIENAAEEDFEDDDDWVRVIEDD